MPVVNRPFGLYNGPVGFISRATYKFRNAIRAVSHYHVCEAEREQLGDTSAHFFSHLLHTNLAKVIEGRPSRKFCHRTTRLTRVVPQHTQ